MKASTQNNADWNWGSAATNKKTISSSEGQDDVTFCIASAELQELSMWAFGTMTDVK